jgi:hypothetical protein
MRTAAGFLTVLCIGALSQVLASEPPSSAPQAAPASAAPTEATTTAADPAAKPPEAAPAATTSPAASSAPAHQGTAPQVTLKAGDELAEAQLKQLRSAGYKPEVRKGQVFFCRNEAPLGSRLEKKVCSTAGQLLDTKAQSQQATQDIQRSPRSVGNP